MKRFLRETWELWYWAMFCPSRLQQRMNAWAPAEEKGGTRADTYSWHIFVLRPNLRFISCYVLSLLCLSLPLVLLIVISGQARDLLLLPFVLLIAYGTGCWFIPISLQMPLLWSLIYLEQPEVWLKQLNQAIAILPLSSPFLGGLGLGVLTLVFSLVSGLWLLLENNFSLARARDVVAIGWILSIFLWSWLATQNWLFVLFTVGLIGLFMFVVREQFQSTKDLLTLGLALGRIGGGIGGGVVAFFVAGITVDGGFTRVISAGVAGFVAAGVTGFVAAGIAVVMISVSGPLIALVVAFGVAGFVATSVAGVVTGGIVGISNLSQLLFLLACWIIGFSLSPMQNQWMGIVAINLLVAVGFDHLSWGSLLAVPVVLNSYYRLVPDYFALDLISYFSRKYSNPLRRLHLLPPYTTELLWLPLPNHSRILSAAFRTDAKSAKAALKTFHKMRSSPLPGLQDTIKQALPQIIVDQLVMVSTVPELIHIATQQHPILPSLVPTFYQSETEVTSQPFRQKPLPFIETEITGLLPDLQTVARDVKTALKSEKADLRVRGLESILNNLNKLHNQLPELRLTEQAIKRWQSVLDKWQKVIQSELEQQRIQSRPEIINPFQSGNPLTFEREYLFKGRTALADQLRRLVVDRSRPTLVLHGSRRCGKSSFLLNLRKLLPAELMPVYLDVQSAAVTTDEPAFCQGLVRAIYWNSHKQGIKLPDIPERRDFQVSPYIALETWLDQALPELGDRRLLINLDEFEKIGSAINQKRISLNLLDELRHLIQHYDQLGFLFSGVQTLDELGPNWSSYFISVVPIEMLYLEPHEAEDLLTNPDPDFTLRYGKGIVAEILTLTRCHPYLLQLIGSALVTQANLIHTQLVTSNLLLAAITESLTLGEPYFTNVWTEFTGTSPAEVKMGQKLLLALAQGQQPDFEVGNEMLVGASLRRLLRYHVIEQTTQGYRVEIPLLERWVRERAVQN